MKISVLIPTYCRVNDLKRCLKGVFAQTIAPHEVVLVVRVDDLETLHYVESLAPVTTCLKVVTIDIPGVVQAMNKGLAEVTSELVAITDDDSQPYPLWLEKMIDAFRKDLSIGGVGGRDWIHQDGLILDGAATAVGELQWFGRMIGNHHLGVGAAREVDFLKGVNCAYRTHLLKEIGFDSRLLGRGAQVHWELSIGLACKRKGWKLIYDPRIGVGHYPSQRFDEDQRGEFNPIALRNAIHNETLIMLEHLSVYHRIVFLTWAFLIGTTSSPGFAQLLRGLLRRKSKGMARYYVSIKGRYLGIVGWKNYNKRAGGAQ